jgi:lactocepin
VHRGAVEVILASPLDGSSSLQNTSAAGKVVLVERGNVPFVQKAINAQRAGATAIVVYNNQDGGPMFGPWW